MDESAIAVVLAASSLGSLVLAQVALRHRRQRRDEQALASNLRRGARLPVSLHPVIDTERCIGSLACLRACPEGDILGIIDGAARLVHADNCVGHGRCAASCPVGAIKLVFGTATRGVDLPEVDERFESSRRGVHVVGELGGMGLIRNAIEQGAQCAAYLAEELAAAEPDGARGDVEVIGAGPAGVGCALALRERGLTVRLLDRGRLGGGIASYPRQGLVMAGPLSLPGATPLRREVLGKAELLAYFEQALARAGQRVEEGVKVTGLSGVDGDLTVQTEAGPIRAAKVVLATGRRGVPRRLGVPGEELAKVTSSLVDAEQYAGKRVLVVGGGDAAVEAACALAERGGVEVTLVHRGLDLLRASPANRGRVVALAGKGALSLRLSSTLTRIEPEAVVLQAAAKPLTIANDFVIACLGGEAPLRLLAAMGVQVRQVFGEEGATRRAGPLEPAPPQRFTWRPATTVRQWLILAGAAVVALLAGLLWTGRGYYPLTGSARLGSALHLALKPASSLGLTIGIAATAVMLTNFLYALRKRWSRLAGVGELSTWLDFHVFVGVMSPAIIAFHAAFQSNNLLASGTYSALGIVVGTGLVGRYFYWLAPGKAVELADLLGQQERLRATLRQWLASAPERVLLARLLEEATAPVLRAALPLQLARSALDAVTFRLRLRIALHGLTAEERGPLRDGLRELQRLRSQASVFGGVRRLLRGWRSLHASLAILLVLALVAHISVAVYLGYGPGQR